MGEKKEIKISLATVICIIIIIVLIAALIGVVLYYNSDKKANVEEIKENKAENSIANVAKNETIKEENLEHEKIYNKYKDEELYWNFKENKNTELTYGEDVFKIENGAVYLINKKDGTRQKISNIKDKAKYILGIAEPALEKIYVLTYEGTIWENDSISCDFKKVNIPGNIIDVTSGNYGKRTIEVGKKFFLLESGELISEKGEKYTELPVMKETIKKISGIWNARSAYEYDEEGKKVEVGLNLVLGSRVHLVGSSIELDDKGNFENKIYATESNISMNGTWYINEIYKSNVSERNYWVVLKYTDGRSEELTVVEDSLGNLRIEFPFSNSYIIMEKD